MVEQTDTLTHDILADLAADARAELRVATARVEALADIRLLATSLSARGFRPMLDLVESDGQVIVLSVDLEDLRQAEGPLSIWIDTDGPAEGQNTIGINPIMSDADQAELIEKMAKVKLGEIRADAEPQEPETVSPAEPEAAQPEPEKAARSSGFTAEEEGKIIEWTQQGMGPTAIAEKLGCHKKAIANFKYRNKGRFERNTSAARPTPRPAPMSEPSPLSGTEREIDVLLNAVGYAGDWTAGRDLQLAQSLARGEGAFATAEALGVDKQEVLDRWALINTDRGSLDHQASLLIVLRHRANAAEAE